MNLFDQGMNDRVQIKRLFMLETGTYNDQFRRSYQTNLTAPLENELQERMAREQGFGVGTFAGVANQFLSPSTEAEKKIQIVEGWNSRRIRFMMEVSVGQFMGAETSLVIMGYTDHYGASDISGAIDPNMRFYINSVMRTRTSHVQTPMGVQETFNIRDASHVIVDNNFDGIYTSKDKRLRPTDLMASIQSSLVGLDITSDSDTRTANTAAPVYSNRMNGLATSYLASTVKAQYMANEGAELGKGMEDIMSDARGHARIEPQIGQDEFMTAIAAIRGGPVSNHFTYKELCMLDPQADQKANLFVQGAPSPMNPFGQQHIAGQTQGWEGTSIQTKLAAIISGSVPALMMECGLTCIAFDVNNQTLVNGQISTIINYAETFSSQDPRQFINRFRDRLESELIRDITYGNQFSFRFNIRADLLGETWISIQLEHYPAEDFVVPSFCDAMLAPVVTGNMQGLMTMVEDFTTIHDHLSNAPHFGKQLAKPLVTPY